jgi:hypothetical protein
MKSTIYTEEEAEALVEKLSETVFLIPCIISPDHSVYIPLATPLSFDRRPRVRHTWSRDEDSELERLTSSLGVKAWTQIARELNAKVYGGRPVRQGKQCRERWFNHVHPGLKTASWSHDEDCFLIKKQKEIGNHWSEIAKLMGDRTENGVKNRWKSLEKKARKQFDKSLDATDRLYELKKPQVEDDQTVASSTDCHLEPTKLEVPDNIPSFSLASINQQSTPSVQHVGAQYPFIHSPYENSPMMMEAMNTFKQMSDLARHFYGSDQSLYMPYDLSESAYSPSAFISRQ